MQLLPCGSLQRQMEKGMAACKRAKALGADIALFPEMWSDGYALPQDAQKLRELAVPADGPFVEAFGALATQLQMAIAVTFLERHEPKPLNSVVLFDRRGERRLHYAKVHTCAFDLERVLAPGEGFSVTELDLGDVTVKVGAMICFDREFPESARLLMLQGAELVLAPNACPMEINRLAALRTRAYENKMAVATCNYPAGQPDCNGHSSLFDGIAWLGEDAPARDMCVFQAPEEEGIYIAELDLDLLRGYREHEVMGDRYRRPETYGLLTVETREPAPAWRGARATGLSRTSSGCTAAPPPSAASSTTARSSAI